VFLGYSFEICQQLAPRRREVERVRSPVGGIATPLGEPTLLEIVDERDHGAAMDPKRNADGLLGLALGSGEVAEHSEVPGMEVEPVQALGKGSMGVRAQLHQQEAGPAAQPLRRGRLPAVGISKHPLLS